MKTKCSLLVCVLGLVFTMSAVTASAADYYAIVDNFGKKPRNAFMDVSVDTSTATAIDVLFSIYDAQGNTLFNDVGVRANAYGFASSAWWANFFDLANGLPILVRGRVPDGAPTSAANLHVDSLAAPMIVESFPTRRGDGAPLGMGTTFPIALGSFRSASLLIANVSGGDVAIDVYKGTRDAIGNGIFSNPRIINNAIWKVSLTQNEALSNLIVTATGFVVVEVVIDDSRTIQSFMVLPRQ